MLKVVYLGMDKLLEIYCLLQMLRSVDKQDDRSIQHLSSNMKKLKVIFKLRPNKLLRIVSSLMPKRIHFLYLNYGYIAVKLKIFHCFRKNKKFEVSFLVYSIFCWWNKDA